MNNICQNMNDKEQIHVKSASEPSKSNQRKRKTKLFKYIYSPYWRDIKLKLRVPLFQIQTTTPKNDPLIVHTNYYNCTCIMHSN